MHRVTAICFDLDNTFWDVWPVIVRAEQVAYEFIQQHYPRIAARYSMEALRSERERVAADEPHMLHDFTYLRIASIKRCAIAAGYEAEAGERVFEVFYKARNAVSLYRDVLPTLQALHGRYRLFTLTNGNADLASIGLHSYFEATFAARDVGALKPHAAAFQHALKHMQLQPEQVLHVGDDPVADVQGARDAGWHTVWLNRDGTTWAANSGPMPITLSKLEDLPALLRKAAEKGGVT